MFFTWVRAVGNFDFTWVRAVGDFDFTWVRDDGDFDVGESRKVVFRWVRAVASKFSIRHSKGLSSMKRNVSFSTSATVIQLLCELPK